MSISKKRRVQRLFARLEAIGVTIDEAPKETLPWLRYIAGLICCVMLTGAMFFLL